MSAALVSAGIAALGSAASGMISSAGSAKAVRKAAQYNRHMYDYQRVHALEDYNMQRQHALDDWNRENEYNSPASQMSRYRDAGLNPNLIYGEGVAASSGQADNTRGTEVRSSQWGNAEAARYNVDFGMAQFAQNMLLSKQAKVLDSQAEKNYADAGLSEQQSTRLSELLPLEKDGKTIDIERAKADIDRISSEIILNTKDLEVKDQYLLESDARIKKTLNEVVISRLELENAIRRTDIDATNAETNRQNANTNQTNAETRQGELEIHQKDYHLRRSQNSLNWHQYEFQKKKQNFQDAMQRAGIQAEESSNIWRTVVTQLRHLSGSINSAIFGNNPTGDSNRQLPNY